MTYLDAIAYLQRAHVAITIERVARLTNKTERAFIVWKHKNKEHMKGVPIVDRVTLRRRHQVQRLVWRAHLQAREGTLFTTPRSAQLEALLGVSRSTVGKLKKDPRVRALLRV